MTFQITARNRERNLESGQTMLVASAGLVAQHIAYGCRMQTEDPEHGMHDVFLILDYDRLIQSRRTNPIKNTYSHVALLGW